MVAFEYEREDYQANLKRIKRIGPYDTCEAYLQKCQSAGFNHAALFEFDTNTLCNQRICELMNLCFTHTGYVKCMLQATSQLINIIYR